MLGNGIEEIHFVKICSYFKHVLLKKKIQKEIQLKASKKWLQQNKKAIERGIVNKPFKPVFWLNGIIEEKKTINWAE